MSKVLPTLVRELNLAVVQRLPNLGYVMLTPAPRWLEIALQPGAKLAQAFPFLGTFLTLASDAWHNGPPARVESGPFEATLGGETMLLRATALTVEDHRLLVIERLSGDADPRKVIQRARERRLEQEILERHAAAVHAPATAVATALVALRATLLTPEARAIADTLARASAALQDAIAPLPKPPERQRRR